MTTSKINWSVGVMEYWNDGLRAPNTHYSVIPTLHHPILLVSSFAPFHPSFRRSRGGVEQRPLGADWRRRDCAKYDANAVTLLVLLAQIVGNRDADVSEVHHLAGRKLDIFADEARIGFGYRDFREDFLRAHHGLPRSFEEFFQINRPFASRAGDLCRRVQGD